MDQIEKQSEILSESVSYLDIDPNQALNPPWTEDYYKLAEAIVEPSGMPEEYMQYMETDPQNWMNWVCTIIGDEYRPFVKHIIENGY